MIYIKEAHPKGGWEVPQNKTEDINVEQPKTTEEREKVATTCATKLALSIPFVVDGADNKVGQAYAAWPDRLYVVGKDGKIAYKAGPGPGGFRTTEMSAKFDEVLKSGK